MISWEATRNLVRRDYCCIVIYYMEMADIGGRDIPPLIRMDRRSLHALRHCINDIYRPFIRRSIMRSVP